MAVSLPVISSNTGGLPEVNVHGETGYLANVGDVDAMSKYAIDILKDRETHVKFKRGALARAKTFTVKSILPLYLDVYNKAIHLVKEKQV